MKYAFLCLLTLGFAAYGKNPYPSIGMCDGLPRVNVKTPEHTCLGVVASDLKTPRGVLPISDNDVLLTEMGSWEPNRGRLSRLRWNGSAFERTTLLDKLDRPHGLAFAPDGGLYVANADKIIKINWQAAQPASTAQTIVTLNGKGHHPLTQMVLRHDELYWAVGAQTDHCEGADGGVVYPCAEHKTNASIWRYRPGADARPSLVAQGLRNSLGLAFSSGGQLLQTENSRDNMAQLPHDEINIIQQGADYGWPYCYDNNRVIPEYQKYPQACAGKTRPYLLLPAHSAPLGMVQYPKNGQMKALRGMWLIALHGYRASGHRVLGFQSDAQGLPTGKPKDIISGWDATPRQPMGAPVDIRIASNGSIYITDDRNDVLLRLSVQ